MSKKTTSLVLIALGVILLVLSLAADVLGIGDRAGIGWKQLLGAAAGVIAVLVGVWLTLRKSNQKK